MTIDCLTGLVAQYHQFPGQGQIVIPETLETCQGVLGRVDVDPSIVTVYNQRLGLQAVVGQIRGTHDSRDAHPAGDNRRVTVTRTTQGHHTHQILPGDLTQCRGCDFLGDKDGVVGPVAATLGIVLQVGQHPGTQIPDVNSTLPEIAVIHALKMPDVLEQHLAQGTLGPLPRLDQ